MMLVVGQGTTVAKNLSDLKVLIGILVESLTRYENPFPGYSS